MMPRLLFSAAVLVCLWPHAAAEAAAMDTPTCLSRAGPGKLLWNMTSMLYFYARNLKRMTGHRP